jgi:hypothetical protein
VRRPVSLEGDLRVGAIPGGRPAVSQRSGLLDSRCGLSAEVAVGVIRRFRRPQRGRLDANWQMAGDRRGRVRLLRQHHIGLPTKLHRQPETGGLRHQCEGDPRHRFAQPGAFLPDDVQRKKATKGKRKRAHRGPLLVLSFVALLRFRSH